MQTSELNVARTSQHLQELSAAPIRTSQHLQELTASPKRTSQCLLELTASPSKTSSVPLLKNCLKMIAIMEGQSVFF